MLVTKFTLTVLCFVLLFAIYVANVMNLITIDHNFYTKNEQRGYNFTQHLLKKYSVSNSDENILWFLQISDIHISIFRDYSRVTDFRRFCQHTVKTIKPSVVLATGDLTDAKEKNNMGSRQFVQEWEYYRDILRDAGMQNITTWLDIRGNHDDFNVINIFSKENYYKNYSIQGNLHPKSYLHTIKKGDMTVAFLGVDACPEPGPKRPFNFIGFLDNAEINTLDSLQKQLTEEYVDHTIWFGHYPTSCVLWLNETSTNHKSLRHLIGNTPSSMAYLCGHLHTMSGLVPKMYTIQKDGFLELELSDWKDNRFFRLGAIDNGLFSFIDQKHGKWPLVLVTNPKNARYVMPGREPLALMHKSRQVRILVFSDADITLVEVSIDGKGWTHCTSKNAPIYKCDWDLSNYLQGLHIISVRVKDANGRDYTEEHPFALDEAKIKFDFGPRFFLMLNATTFFQTTFATFLLLCVMPLIILRLQKNAPRNERRFMSRVHRKLWVMSNVDSIFYPLILYALYLPIGPWSVGELIDGHIGIVFAWGIFVNGTFLPGSFTYAFGSLQLGLVQLPLTLILANSISDRVYNSKSGSIRKYIKHLPFIMLLTIQMLMAYTFWLSYGTMAFLFGPLRSWSVLLSLVLWYKAVTLPHDYGRKLMNLTSAP